jgi:hypothetical protein
MREGIMANRSVTITDTNAKPKGDKEVMDTIQMTANALQGTWGDGDWDGGITGAVGSYCKRGIFWDAKLVYTISGSATIKFPFTVVESIVRITNTATLASVISYIQKGKTLAVTGSGKFILEVLFVRNTKEV